MNEYQANQRELQQFYQAQRIQQLQEAQMRHSQMSMQNQTRFTTMRDQFLAAAAPRGQAPVASQMGFTGRNISQVGAGGAANQSMFGTMLDANAASFRNIPGIGRGFSNLGYQFGVDRNVVSNRARQQLDVFGAQIPNVAMNAVLPDFAQRLTGRVGLGDVQEGGLAVSDTFAGYRGIASGTLTGRGMSATRSADAYQGFVRRMNRMSDSALSNQDIKSLGSTALGSLTSSQIASSAEGGPNAIAALLEKQVKALEKISKNTGVSVERMGELVKQNMSMGNDMRDLATASSVVGSNQVTTTASRTRQTQTALALTAQGRQLNVANAGRFGANQMDQIYGLVGDFNAGIVDRAELFRYGGRDSFEAAERVQQQRIQSGNVFRQSQTGTLGVLGSNAQSSLNSGFFGNISDVTAAYAKNPFAGLVARFDYGAAENLIGNQNQLALQKAKNNASLIKGMNPESRDAFIKSEFARLTGRSDLDAGREVDSISNRENRISKKLDEWYDSDSGKRIDPSRTRRSVLENSIIPELLSEGVPIDAILQPNFLARAASPAVAARVYGTGEILRRGGKSAQELLRTVQGTYLSTQYGATERAVGQNTKKYGFSEEEAMEIMGLEPGTKGLFGLAGSRPKETSEALRALRSVSGDPSAVRDRALSTELIDNFLRKNKLNQKEIASIIFKQGGADGNQDFGSIGAIMEGLGTDEGAANIFSKLSGDEMDYVRKRISGIFTRDVLHINSEASNKFDGSPGSPIYVKQAEGWDEKN